MTRLCRIIIAALIVLVLIGALAAPGNPAYAQQKPRQVTIVVPYTAYEWWLIQWEGNQILCRIVVDHEGLPTEDEVLDACGSLLYNLWINTPPCADAAEGKKDVTTCKGLYLHLISASPSEKEVVVDLPPPSVWVSLEGCQPKPPENLCQTIPYLLLTGEEPLPNEKIVSIRGTYAGQPFSCPGSVCKLALQPTPLEGVLVEFWALSSYGDESEHFTARVRVIDSGVSAAPGSGGWYVDVISSQWVGPPLASCARIWQSFPPAGGLPEWLTTPEQPGLLATGEPFFYLAGRLIAQGLVDASQCPQGGMLPNGYADACGMERAKPLLLLWQNQFDKRMVEVAKETGIPAQLMKNLFAQESQFWPGMFRVPYEYGLGQITDSGADSILIWNQTFFEQFCPLVLAEETCAKGYFRLTADEKALLRGAVASLADSNCADCPTGIDLSHANFSVSLFAQTLLANCAQVGQTVTTATELTPGLVASYEDLWRFTVANYHAGPGCVSFAIHQAWMTTGRLNWETVSARFTEACKGVVPYVNRISEP
jgi:hypothetical protein